MLLKFGPNLFAAGIEWGSHLASVSVELQGIMLNFIGVLIQNALREEESYRHSVLPICLLSDLTMQGSCG